MDNIEEKSIYDKFLSYSKEAQSIPIEDKNRQKFARLSVKSFRDVERIYGRDAEVSKIFRNYVHLFRSSNKLSTNEVKEFIDKIKYFSQLLSKFNNKENNIIISKASSIPPTKDIFIIHGHDEINTLRLYNMLRDEFYLNPIKIVNKPGQGKSIIDKFETNASTCSFSFALFSKDDEIIKKDGNYFQARPNVIFEAGWFTGRLSKNRLVILLQNGTKIHSDFDGISRIQFNDNVEEKYIEIKNELSAANLL